MHAHNTTYRPIMDHLPLGLWREFFGTLFLCTAVFATFFNGCVLVIMRKHKSLRTPSNIILAVLAFVDFLEGSIVAPLYAAQLLCTDVAKLKYVEEIRRTIAAMAILTSSNIVGFISFDRHLHMVKLSKYKMPQSKLYGGIACCWVIPILTAALRFIPGDNEYIYSIAIDVEVFGSLIIILIFYFIIVASLRHHGGRLASMVQQSHLENQKRTTKTVTIILLFYILMNLPITVNRVFVIVGGMDWNTLSKSYVIGGAFRVNNSVVNPVIYCLQTPPLRRKFIELFVRHDGTRRPRNETTFTVV